MKKHSEALAKIQSADLQSTAETIRKDISDLKRNIRGGNVQNYKVLAVKKKELARVLTRRRAEERTTK
jgi:ribosomal protein L29